MTAVLLIDSIGQQDFFFGNRHIVSNCYLPIERVLLGTTISIARVVQCTYVRNSNVCMCAMFTISCFCFSELHLRFFELCLRFFVSYICVFWSYVQDFRSCVYAFQSCVCGAVTAQQRKGFRSTVSLLKTCTISTRVFVIEQMSTKGDKTRTQITEMSYYCENQLHKINLICLFNLITRT